MKDFDLQKLIRKNIQELTPYSSARSEFKGDAHIFLDANENSMASAWNQYSRYPDPLQGKLKEKIGALKGVSSSKIFLGNGSDEAIDLLIRATCVPGQDNVVALAPTYGMYRVCAEINDVEVREVSLNEEFQPIIGDVLAAINEQTKLLFICSPNNPSGNTIHADLIEILVTNFNGITIIDEAYIDFAENPSWVSKLNNYPNVVILQTFSKAWGMAGLRMGMAFASEALIDIMNKIKAPYNLSAPVQEMVIDALVHTDRVKEAIKTIKEQRALVMGALKQLPFVENVYPSDANFILVRVSDANPLYRYLLKNKIIVRNRSKVPLCENCLRITIGTPEENKILLDTLNKYQP